ncbi:MAG: hypothetical protein ACAH83_17635 [Alphaproteobacteria bacterium]
MKKRPDSFLKLAALLTLLLLAAQARADLVSSPWPRVSPRPETLPSYISRPSPYIVQFYSQYDIFSAFAAWIGGLGFFAAGCLRCYQAWKTAEDAEQRPFLRRTAVAYFVMSPFLLLSPFLSASFGLPVAVSALAFACMIGGGKKKAAQKKDAPP